ncbi:MAG TPA: N-succinylarginine dihydrolase [Opitutaceae bacterium]|nr:N-succinylarginine dihydrolase [Opitutaceae bacterium]
MSAHEVNFDGIVGPTHNYAGLSFGNLASTTNKAAVSNPREAALQGLAKMKAIADLGVHQAVLPPHERPDIVMLRARGFEGTDAEVLASSREREPALLASACSASAMWAANACTVAPSADTDDHRVHITPANLAANLHRSIEAATSTRILRAIFSNETHFTVHDPIAGEGLGDEGAANHTRFGPSHGARGFHFFVHGDGGGTSRFPARQTRAASEAVARQHRLDPRGVFFARQGVDAIDAGAFHNDVVAVGNRELHLFHEQAFAGGHKTIKRLGEAYASYTGRALRPIEVQAEAVSLQDAISSYLFNSQLVSLPDDSTVLVAPAECMRVPSVAAWLDAIVKWRASPISRVLTFDLRESMRNGGGPACLRQRIVLTDGEIAAAAPGVFLNDTLHAQLVTWVRKHYRECLAPDDLADPALLEESRRALDELTQILGLGALYPFQTA